MFRSWWDHQTTFVPNGTPDAFPSRSALGRVSGRIPLQHPADTLATTLPVAESALRRHDGQPNRDSRNFPTGPRTRHRRERVRCRPRPLTCVTRNGRPVARIPRGTPGFGPRRAQGSNRRVAAVSRPDPRPGDRPVPQSGRPGRSGCDARSAEWRTGDAGGSISRHTFAPEAGSQWVSQYLVFATKMALGPSPSGYQCR